MAQDDIAPEHHLAVPGRDFPLDFSQKVEIHAALADPLAKSFALAATQIPRLIAAHVEKAAGKVRQQFIVKLADELDGVRMIRRQRRRETQEIAGWTFVWCRNFREFAQRRVFEPATQMAERILVWHEVNAQFAATRIKLANLPAGQSPPTAPHGLVIAIGERVLDVELKLVDLEIGQMFDELEKRLQLRHAPA